MRITNLMTALDNMPNQVVNKVYITDKTTFRNFTLEDFYNKDSINHFSELYAKLDLISTDIGNSSSTASNTSIPTVGYVNRALNNTFFFKENISKTNSSTNIATVELIDDSNVLYLGDNNSSSTIIRGASSFSNDLSFHMVDDLTDLSETEFNNMPKLIVPDHTENILTLKTDKFHINGDLIISDKNSFTINGDAKTSGTIYCDSILYIDKKTTINKKMHIKKQLFIDKEARFNKRTDAKDLIIINNTISKFEKNLKISNNLKLNQSITTLGNTTVSENSTLNNYGESIFNGKTTISDTLKIKNLNSLKSKFSVIKVSNDVNILNNSKSTIDSLIVEDSSNLNIAEIAKTLTLNTELKINKTSQMQSLNVLGKIESKLLDIKGNFIVNPYSEINGATKVSNNLSTPNMTVNQIEVKGTTTINCESIFNNDFTVQGGTFINYGEFLVNQLTITNNIIVTNSSNFLKDVEVMGSLDIYQTCSTPDSIKGNIVTDRLSVKDKLTCKTIKVNGDDVHIIGNLPLLDLSNVNTLITNTTNTAKLDALNNSNFQTIETQNSNIIAKKLFIKDSLIAKETRMIINKDIFNWSRTELKTSILNITGDKAIDIGNHWIKGANRLTGIRIHPQGFIQIGELTNMNESDYQEYKGGDLIVNQDLVVNGLFDYKETPFTIPEIISTKNILFPLRLRKINLLSDITHDIETSYENEYYRYPTLIAKNRIGIHIDSPICRLHIGGNPDEVDYNKYVKIDFSPENDVKLPPGVYANITLEDTEKQKDKFI